MNPLYRNILERAELSKDEPAQGERQTVRIAVHRNHSFELSASVIQPFLALSGLRAEFSYSAYDDSLSFGDLPPADLHLLWLDAARYKLPDFNGWLEERIAALRELTQKRGESGSKILAACLGVSGPNAAGPHAAVSDAPGQRGFADFPDAQIPDFERFSRPGALFMDCGAAIAFLGKAAYDPRLEKFSGTRLSNQACLQLARELGTKRIPALLLPAMKGLVLDLDHTLYSGVLGEDGPEGLTPFRALQLYLAGLGRQGFLLALSSKNEEEDVRRLFELRRDFPLRWEDFSAVSIGWHPKPEGLLQIAEKLRIGPDSLLFVDDNPGERLRMRVALPEVRVLEAAGPAETLAALRYCPGLFRPGVGKEDSLRRADLAANAARDGLRRELPAKDYFAELQMELLFEINPQDKLGRIFELLHKTNQFVLSLARPSATELASYLRSAERCVISISMRDRLSDSGLIAAGLFEKKAGALRVDELAVSCRALGRGVEDGMLRIMINLAEERLQTGAELELNYSRGSRNKPALDWLTGLSGKLPPSGRRISLPRPAPEAQKLLPGVRLKLPEKITAGEPGSG